MALLFCEGFEHYQASFYLKKWPQAGTPIPTFSTPGRFGTGTYARVGGNSNHLARWNTGSSSVFIVGAAIRAVAGAPNAMQLCEGSEYRTHGNLMIDAGGTWVLYRYPAGSASGVASGYFVPGLWHYWEVKYKVHETDGGYEVRLNGETVAKGGYYADGGPVSLDTQNGGSGVLTTVYFGQAANKTIDYDDIYICDTSGSTNNDFLGEIKVETLFPNGNGATSNLTGSDGNSTDNYLLVDEASGTFPNTADYVESSTVDYKDTYEYTDLAMTSGSVLGVQVLSYAAKTDAGLRQIANIARSSGGTEELGDTQTLSADATYYYDTWDTPPGGGSWDISSVNGAQFGVKVIA